MELNLSMYDYAALAFGVKHTAGMWRRYGRLGCSPGQKEIPLCLRRWIQGDLPFCRIGVSPKRINAGAAMSPKRGG